MATAIAKAPLRMPKSNPETGVAIATVIIVKTSNIRRTILYVANEVSG